MSGMNLHVHRKDHLSQSRPFCSKTIFSVKLRFVMLLGGEEKNTIRLILSYKSNAWLQFECGGLAFKLSLGKKD